jgi:hypothetical protein
MTGDPWLTIIGRFSEVLNYKGRHALGEAVMNHRLNLPTQII